MSQTEGLLFVADEIAPYETHPKSCQSPRLAFSNSDRGVYLYHGDCIEVMERILRKHPNGCFDMIFADPPYRLSNGGMTCVAGKAVKVDKGAWDKSEGIEIDYAFTKEWLSSCQKLLKKDGTIWVSGTHHIIHIVGFVMQQLGLKILNEVAWEKPNPPPNLSCRYFTHSTETLLWAAKSDRSKHVFNYADMRSENGGKQMKTVWQFLPPGKSEKSFGKHPTQKPIQLITRCIRASTQVSSIIFDPFSGSSTTGIASIILGRKFCGIEQDQSFIDISVGRIEQAFQGDVT